MDSHSRVVFETDGLGLWSDVVKSVRINNMVLDVLVDDDTTVIGELRVYFNTNDWDTQEYGLIYTDPKFGAEVRSFLASQGFGRADDVMYSEQGMQGHDYVSFDVSHKFIEEARELRTLMIHERQAQF